MQDDAPAYRKNTEDLGVNEHHVCNLFWFYTKISLHRLKGKDKTNTVKCQHLEDLSI